MEIIVQGKGTKYFTPNEIILNLNFYQKKNSYKEALNFGITSVQNFTNNILLKNGFGPEDLKTRNFVIREEQKFDNVKRQNLPDGFSYNQTATIKFDYDKEKLSVIMEQLSNLDDAPKCNISFGVKDEKECRRQILSEAYKDAQLQAQAIAEASGKELKQCIRVDFKPFTTSYISQTNLEESMVNAKSEKSGIATMITNTFTPEDIELSETLYCLWNAE